jgi:hypothetical protein
VASSAGFGGTELAGGFVSSGQRLLVQACRVAGGGATATLATNVQPLGDTSGETLSVVEVATKDRGAKARLQGLGLDLTEHGTDTTVEVVLHGKADADELRDAGFTWKTEIADLAQRAKRNKAADAAYAGRTSPLRAAERARLYRRLGDYEAEMKALAARYPDLVKPLTLPNRAWRAVRCTASRSRPTPPTPPTASPSSSTWACTTRVSGRPPSTRWSGPTTCSPGTARTPDDPVVSQSAPS